MDTLLVLLKNVVLSTLHGWVGASLAVFMFFRPLKPWRIGKIKVWQGVIPGQQAQIAEAVSEVVARDLITPQALQEYLVGGQALDRQVRFAVQSLIMVLANTEYSTLESIFPPLAADLKEDLKERSKQALAGWAEKYLTEPEVEDWLKSFSHRQLNRLWQKRLGELWPENNAAGFFSRLSDSLITYFAGPEFKDSVLDLTGRQYLALRDYTATLREVLPWPVKEKIEEWPAGLVQVLPELVQRLQENEEFQSRLTAVILNILEDLKEKGLLARVGIGLYQFFNDYRDDVENFVRSDMIPRLSGFLNSPDVKVWLEQYIREQADKILDRPVGELVRELSESQVERFKEWLAANLSRWMGDPGVRTCLGEFMLGRYRVLAGCTVAELVDRFAGFGKAEVESALAGQGLSLLRQPVTLRFVRLAARSLVEEIAGYRIGRLGSRISPVTLEKIESTTVGLVSYYLKSQIPAFLAGLDLKDIVKSRIEAYSPKELVDMFQRVTMNNLQKIEIYGAAIGFIMGVFFGLANLRADAFWFITAVLAGMIALIRWGRK